MAEEEVPKVKKLKIGKKGVMAKRAAIDETCRDVQKAARDISQEGQRRMSAGIREKTKGIEEAVKKMEAGIGELQSAIQVQIKETEDAVARISNDTKKLAGEYRKYIRGDFSNAVKGLQSNTQSFIKDTVGGYTRDFWFG